MKQVRCAIYTRKSSEEGLEQSFNSLDAQREACAAYILSQASEGWSALPDAYDDGGLSGGSLERPALKRLMADIEAGKVDIVVVYKVDRLTRSLFDFAKLVEVFDKAGVSFVSVTQSFNTTTSMGRLTLNMLLSFAQFEREVTAERIRDKLAASKAKGMWMGGLLRQLVLSVAVHDERIVVTCDAEELSASLGQKLAAEAPDGFSLEAQVRLQRSGHALRLIQDNGTTLVAAPSQSAVMLLVKARRWWAVLRSGETDITRLAASEGVTASYMTRVVRTAFLSPAVVEAILAGSARAQVDAAMLVGTGTVIPSWSEQKRRLLPP